jgi:hypothetical protein
MRTASKAAAAQPHSPSLRFETSACGWPSRIIVGDRSLKSDSDVDALAAELGAGKTQIDGTLVIGPGVTSIAALKRLSRVKYLVIDNTHFGNLFELNHLVVVTTEQVTPSPRFSNWLRSTLVSHRAPAQR